MKITMLLLAVAIAAFVAAKVIQRRPSATGPTANALDNALSGILYSYFEPSYATLARRVVNGVMGATPKLATSQPRLRRRFVVRSHPLDHQIFCDIGLSEVCADIKPEIFAQADRLGLAAPSEQLTIRFEPLPTAARGFPRVAVEPDQARAQAEPATASGSTGLPPGGLRPTRRPTRPVRVPTRPISGDAVAVRVRLVGPTGVFELRGDAALIGADPDADLVLTPRRDIDSWRAATLTTEHGLLYITDGDGNSRSTNGVYVNGSRVDGRARLADGDVVHFATPTGQGWHVESE